MPWILSLWLLLGILATLAGCGAWPILIGRPDDDPGITYAKVLARARAGDPEQQNLLGVMLFFGEGVPRDRAEAHRWFHAAADMGNHRAQRNLAVMHYLGAGGGRDLDEADHYFRLARDRSVAGTGFSLRGRNSIAEVVEAERARAVKEPRRGERAYVTFCAGCHGLNGIAAYVNSPSFAVGERLEKSDAELLRSLRDGLGEMPGWADKLPPGTLADLLAFVRALPGLHELGVLQSLRPAPAMYFLFGPMRANPAAYQGLEDDVERLLRTRRR